MNTIVTSKEEILKTSREMIRQQGWSAISIRSVAAACGVSVGSIYNYFDSKSVQHILCVPPCSLTCNDHCLRRLLGQFFVIHSILADTKNLRFSKPVFKTRLVFKYIIINADDFIHSTHGSYQFSIINIADSNSFQWIRKLNFAANTVFNYNSFLLHLLYFSTITATAAQQHS